MYFSQRQLLRSAVIGCGLWSCGPTTNAFEQIKFPSQSVVSAMYRTEFGERVELPATYESSAGAECGGYPYLTSTAYLNVSDQRADLLTLHIAPDGSLLRK